MVVVLRADKGSALTHAEVDGNFSTLDGKAEGNADALAALDASTTAAQDALTDGVAANAAAAAANTAEISTNTSAIASHDGRLTAVEAAGTGNGEDIAALDVRVTDAETAISTNGSAISDNAAAITGNADAITAQGGRLDTAEAAITSNAGAISTNAGAISDNAAAVAALSDSLAAAIVRIDALEAGQAAQDALISQIGTDLEAHEALAAETFVAAGFGQMALTGPAVPGASIGVAYQTLNAFNDIRPAVPVGVDLDTTTGTFAFTEQGLWQFSFVVDFTHEKSAADRETTVRIYDQTNAVAGDGVRMITSRDSYNLSSSGAFLVDVAADEIGDIFRLEIGGGDTFQSVVWQNQIVTLQRISPMVRS